MRKSLFAFLVVVFAPLLIAQQAMNNDAVIKLCRAGLSDDLIVSTINSAPGSYDTSPDGIIGLKNASASDKVVAAIVAKAAAPPPMLPAAAGTAETPAAAIAAPPDPDDPMTPHDPGIYMLQTSHGGGHKMVLIERAGSGRQKTANVWGYAFSYGIAKAKVKAEVPGPRAAVRSEDARPVFYMYFPPTGNLGAADTISSPSQFSLLSLEAKPDHRETTVAKVGIGSASAGNDDKRTVKFSTEKIKPYSYKVEPEGDLKTGEYAFIASTGTAGASAPSNVVIFDFGVDLQ